MALSGAAPTDACANLKSAATPTLEIASAAREGVVCRIEAIARPRPTARIAISLWLPPANRWSGRYYQMGNGGFAGSIDRATLAAAASRGDAAAATDTGHVGTGFDAGWARDRPDLIEDYAWRSIKVTADIARILAARYYGRLPQRRYFMGCSFGGRQALVAASRWPGDWDGIIAGAPAIRWLDWLQGMATVQRQLRHTAGGWIAPERLWPRPMLTARQRSSLIILERAGYHRTDADPAEWKRRILNADPNAQSQARLATEAQRNLFAVDPAWTLARRSHPTNKSLSTTFAVGRLDPYLRRGGKLIAYVGTADAVLPPRQIVTALRQRITTARSGVRLLTLPGMAHCQGGMAPYAFGQAVPAPALRDDAEHDIRRALEAWVENGRTPPAIKAADPSAAAGVTRLPLSALF